MRRTFYIYALFFFLFSAHAIGNEDSSGKAFMVSIPQLSEAPKIDGKLEDSVWREAVVLENFTQYEPLEGSDPTEKTIAYIGYDSNNLYLAIRCFDSNPKAVRACLTQRDKSMGDDEVTVYLDTFNDKKRAFAFVVNPCGVQTDGIFTEQRQMGRGRRGGGGGGGGGFDRIDKNWDTFFSTDAFIDDAGFSVELAIPFKSLRFPNSLKQTWGLQIKRKIPRKNEEIYWYPRSRDINGFLIQSGTMTIEGDLAKGKNLEIMPVVTGLKERQGVFKPEPGINFKYGITSDLTADMALNPDFSQVEADMPQIDVNQRYALYYREKRPFFLEGKDLFDTPLELVYTRKIVNPLWGAKLTGKIGKTSLAFLSAFDESPPEIDIGFDDDDDDEEEEEEETDLGRSWVNVFRMKQDLFSESNIGFILTDKEMGAAGQSLSRNFNRVAGVDGFFKFKKNYQFSFQVLGSQSRVTRETTGIDEKTDVIPAMFFNFRRNSRHWSLSADYTQMPEEFEAATGYFRRKDIRSLRTRLGYNLLPQNKYIVDIRPSIEYRRIYDFNNILTDEQFRIGGFMSGWRGTFLFASYSQELERYEGINFRKKNTRLSLNSEPFSWFSGNISYSFGDGIYYDENPYLGYLTSIGMRLTFKPLTTLRFFYNIRQDNFTRGKGGERVYRINIISQRINIQLSKPLSLRLITDYNDYYKEVYSSILLSYQLNPGTVFYVGIDDNQSMNDSGIYDIEGRYFFVKFSYWWRI